MFTSPTQTLTALAAGCALFAPSLASQRPATAIVTTPALERNLVISEVGAGPLQSYVELFNGTSGPITLADVEIETSQGLFSLAGCTVPLPPDSYFVLTTCRPEEQVATDKPETLLKAVAQQVVGVISDTVLVRLRGEISDAVCYGLSPDSSPRYQAAIQATQFADGQFVDVSTEFNGLAIGRNKTATDTDNLDADWTTHGGADALCGSPLSANTGVMGGEDFAIKAFQSRFNQIFANNYYTLSVTGAGYTGYTGSDTNSSATHTFVVDSPDFGNGIALSGRITFVLVPQNSGAYEMRMTGTLSAPAPALSINVSCTQAWSGSKLTSTVNAGLIVEATGDVLPYDETVSLQYSGVRGAFTVAQDRVATDLDGVARKTSATQNIIWRVVAGQVYLVNSTVDMKRDFPAVSWPYSWGQPHTPFTTENLHYDLVLGHHAAGDGYVGTFSKYTANYGAQYGVATYDNASLSFRRDYPNQAFNYNTAATITFPSPGGTVTNAGDISVASVPFNSNLVTVHGQLYSGSAQVGSYQLTIDPPVVPWPDWLDSVGRGIKTGAKWVGHVGATVVTGGICALGTTVTAAAAGISTVASLGTASPAGIAGTVVVGGSCVYVSNLVYESTKPN